MHIYFSSTKTPDLAQPQAVMQGSVKHGDIKFWFSGVAYTGKHLF